LIYVFNFTLHFNTRPTISLLVKAEDVLLALKDNGIYLNSQNAKINFDTGEAQFIGELKPGIAPTDAGNFIEDEFNRVFVGQGVIKFVQVYEQKNEQKTDLIDIILEFLPAGKTSYNALVTQYGFERLAAFLLLIALWMMALLAIFYLGIKVVK